MSRCARCGLEEGDRWGACSAYYADNGPGIIACRDREIANLRSLLRTTSIRLESALTLLDDIHEPCSVRRELESILESLS